MSQNRLCCFDRPATWLGDMAAGLGPIWVMRRIIWHGPGMANPDSRIAAFLIGYLTSLELIVAGVVTELLQQFGAHGF